MTRAFALPLVPTDQRRPWERLTEQGEVEECDRGVSRNSERFDADRVHGEEVVVAAVAGRRCRAQEAREAGIVAQLEGAERELGTVFVTRTARNRRDRRGNVDDSPVPEPARRRYVGVVT